MMDYGTSFFRKREDVFRFLNKIYYITCIVISTSVLTLLLRKSVTIVLQLRALQSPFYCKKDMRVVIGDAPKSTQL